MKKGQSKSGESIDSRLQRYLALRRSGLTLEAIGQQEGGQSAQSIFEFFKRCQQNGLTTPDAWKRPPAPERFCPCGRKQEVLGVCKRCYQKARYWSLKNGTALADGLPAGQEPYDVRREELSRL